VVTPLRSMALSTVLSATRNSAGFSFLVAVFFGFRAVIIHPPENKVNCKNVFLARS